MLGLVSTSSAGAPVDILKVALPIGIGLASAAYLTLKAVKQNGFSTDKSIPMVPLRAGDSTHDAEFYEDEDRFLARCNEEYGLVFNCYLQGQQLSVVSGPLAREVFMTEKFSFTDMVNEITGLDIFANCAIKSNKNDFNRVVHEVVRDTISPNLPLFTPRIVKQLRSTMEEQIGHCEGKLIEKPLDVFQDMIAGAMATVFMGHEVSKDSRVLRAFIECTYDFAAVVGKNNVKSFWRSFNNRAKYGLANPLRKHIAVLVECATPVVLERRRLEKEANEKGVEYDRPLDVMQKLLDNFDKYGFVDLEDVCGYLLLIVLASVHTTSDSSMNLCYYLAAFPECVEQLYQEQLEILGQVTKEREALRQSKIESGEVASTEAFEGTELDPKNDKFLTAGTVKRMVYMDSFVREAFRFRSERVSLAHLAKSDVTLSNGMVISKGSKVIINMYSVHHNDDTQGRDSKEFRPWRFVGQSKAATKVSGEFLPFGMGRHACPGRFLAIQELKTVGALMVTNYSKIEIQDPSKSKKALLSRMGNPIDTGLIFTSR